MTVRLATNLPARRRDVPARARKRERALDPMIFSDVVDWMDLVGVGKNPGFPVCDKRIVLPTAPQLRHHVDEFAGAVVTVGVSWMSVKAEIQRC